MQIICVCDHTHTQMSNQFVLSVQKHLSSNISSLVFSKGSELTANYSWWPTKASDGSQCSQCLPTHLHPRGWDGAHSHFVTPQGTLPLLSLSLPYMRNRWGGAIKWICCYFPRLLAEDVKPQPVRQPRLTADSGRGKHTPHSLLRTWWAFMLLCNLSNCLGMWWMGPDLKRKKGIRFALGRCHAHVRA